MGTAIYALSSKGDEKVEKALCIVNGRLCKRNIVAHEVLAGLLGAEDLYRLLQPLLFDHGDSGLEFYFKCDSLCSLAMLNPQVALKNTLLDNAVNGFVEEMKKISLEFPKSLIKIGYTESLKNPADFMTKLFSDPSQIINSSLYRFGDPNMKTIDVLETDTIATYSKGKLQFLGIPDKILEKSL